MSLFKLDAAMLHSGDLSWWKINCEFLTDDDLRCVAAHIVYHCWPWSKVVGIPRGGLRLAELLKHHPALPGAPVLIVDDVYTTGRSMKKEATKHLGAKGAVIFAREPVTEGWIWVMWTLGGKENEYRQAT